jgi:hypothetical protein
MRRSQQWAAIVRAVAQLAIAAMRSITLEEGKPFSYRNLRAGVLARAVPMSARAPTMAQARRRPQPLLGAAVKHR